MLQLECQTKNRLTEQCLRIAEKIVCYNEEKSAPQYLIELDAVFNHADSFFNLCFLEMCLLDDYNIDPMLIFPALSYLEKHFATPSALNDINWFSDTLNTLLSFFRDDENIIDDSLSAEFLGLLLRKLNERIKNGED